MKCAKCPPHSSTHEDGSVNCRCENNYFRADKDPPSMACTREQFCCNPCLHVCFIYLLFSYYYCVVVVVVFQHLAHFLLLSMCKLKAFSASLFMLGSPQTQHLSHRMNQFLNHFLQQDPQKGKKKNSISCFRSCIILTGQGRLQAWDLHFYFSIPSCYVLVIGHREKELRFIKLILRFS